jgi:hypothetical protein
MSSLPIGLGLVRKNSKSILTKKAGLYCNSLIVHDRVQVMVNLTATG